MPLLQVRDFPEDIYKKIVNEAKKQNRTISQQVVVMLERYLGRNESNVARRKELIKRISSRKISNEVKAIDPVVLIREDRDR